MIGSSEKTGQGVFEDCTYDSATFFSGSQFYYQERLLMSAKCLQGRLWPGGGAMKSSGEKSIVIVEDSEPDLALLLRTLEKASIKNPIHSFRSATEAMDYLEHVNPSANCANPAIIFADLNLHEVDGFQFLEWVRAKRRFDDVLLIAISGLDDFPSMRRAYRCGANSFIRKPCTLRDLDTLVLGFPKPWVHATLENPGVGKVDVSGP
jgi:two-component system response regulator